MTKQELEARVEALQNEITRLKDIEEIKKLQRIYGYYLEHWQWDQVVDLFSDAPDTTCELSNFGVYVGKAHIKEFFYREPVPPEFLHVLMQISGVVDLDPNGKTAKGRWYGFGLQAIPTGKEVSARWSSGIYEDEYIKEGGKWKFKKLHWNRIFNCTYEDGWVKNPVPSIGYSAVRGGREQPPNDRPATAYKPYPSGYIFPYHYKNPITRK